MKRASENDANVEKKFLSKKIGERKSCNLFLQSFFLQKQRNSAPGSNPTTAAFQLTGVVVPWMILQ
jgi:hypothetical protein